MRKLIASIISGCIPSRFYRYKVRGLINAGIFRQLKILRVARKTKPKHFLSVVAIAKNEGIYFREWIEFHRLVGVEKFYIYDNESNDGTPEILKPYIDAGIVEYKFWPGAKMQFPAYNDCVEKHRFDTEWLALIDLDEFMVPMRNETIAEFLTPVKNNVSQVIFKWVHFGSSGHEKRPKGLVTENYKMRAADNTSKMDAHFKCIVRPSRMLRCKSSHSCETFGTSINENHEKIYPAGQQICRGLVPFDKVRIHHYQCKSLEDLKYKMIRGDAVHGRKVNTYTKERIAAIDKNEIRDDTMDKWIPLLKQKD